MRAGMRRSCCAVSFAGFLIACASSRIDRGPLDLGDRFDVAHRGAVGGDDDVGVGRPRRRSRRPTRGSRRGARRPAAPGVNRAASAAQLPTTAGGAITERGAVAGAGEQVGEHRRRLAEAHVEGEAAAEAGGVEEAEPRAAPRPGSCAARRRSPSGCRGRLGATGSPAAASRSAAQPPPSTEMPPASGEPSRPRARRSISAPDELGRRWRARRARPAAALRSARSMRDPPAAGADERPRFLGQLGDVGGGELDVVEHRRPPHVGELAGADDRRLRRRRRTPAATASRVAGDSSGTRTSKPAAARRGPVIGHQLPRLVLAQHHLAAAGAAGPQQRGHHAFEARRARLRGRDGSAPPSTMACSIGTSCALRAGLRSTARCHAPPSSGGSSRTIKRRVLARDRAGPVARPVDTSSPATRDGRVERAAVEAGEERLGDVVGGAHVRAAARAPRCGGRCRGRSRRPCR